MVRSSNAPQRNGIERGKHGELAISDLLRSLRWRSVEWKKRQEKFAGT